MTTPKYTITLINPPVVKPSEPPAGIARLTGVLRAHGVRCDVFDANIDGLNHVISSVASVTDTWTRRAVRHLENHLILLRNVDGYSNKDRYIRAVSDINRVLSSAGKKEKIHLSLGDYRDERLKPVESNDLLQAAGEPSRNPFYEYFRTKLIPRLKEMKPAYIGISINYLSQALCAFALIGMIQKECSSAKIVVGGGLITSWMRQQYDLARFEGLVDQFIAGLGELPLLGLFELTLKPGEILPDYNDFMDASYLSPGFILPFSASDGCWWRRCAFCPERAEKRPFRPLPHNIVITQLQALVARYRPVMVHLLDNAISPALLKKLATSPPGAPWYGFVRIGAPLDDIAFCRQLAASGCAMLKIGLESGSQNVLDHLDKGILLGKASRVLENLHTVGILTYVYLLFGTPAENEATAKETMSYVIEHAANIDFLNLAIFNLPTQSPDARGLQLSRFYDGDLSLYHDFKHPGGWNRPNVRRFVDGTFKKHPTIQAIIRRDPPVFTSNHAVFLASEHNVTT